MLREFDIFNQVIRLNYKDANSFSTNTGCFFTACVVAITVIQGIFTFRSILSYQTPQVTTERTQLENPGYFALNSSEFQFMINVEGGLNFSSSFLSFRMFYIDVFKLEDGSYGENKIEVPYKKCPSNYFEKFPVGSYPPGLSETGICPDTTKIELNGSSYQSENFKRLGIEIIKCVNNTHPDITCKSSEEIEDILKNPVYPITASLFYTNTILSPTNYSTPSIYYLDYEEYYLPPAGFTTQAEVPINQQDLITDDNLVMEGLSSKTYTTYQIDPNEMKVRMNNLITNDLGQEVMLAIWLRRSSKLYTTKRLYPTLQEGLASVGSVFTLSVAVFGLITSVYGGKAYAINITNQLFEYDFHDPEKEKKKAKKQFNAAKKEKMKSPSKKKEESLKVNSNGTSTYKENGKKSDKDEEDAQLPKLLLQQKQKLRYHFGDFLLDLFPCIRRDKKKLIRNAVAAAEKEIDLIEILKKLQQFDKLKQILLDEDELMMISYYQPPVISLYSSPVQEKASKDKIGRKKRNKTTAKSIQADQQSSMSKVDISKDSNAADPKEDKTDMAITAAQKFNRLLQKRKVSPISEKILKIMDPKVSDALFNFGIESKAFSSSNMSQNIMKKSNGKKISSGEHRKMTKLEAAMFISSRLQNYLLRRRMKKKLEKPVNDDLNSYKQDQSNHDDLDNYSILSEKKPLEFVSPMPFEISNSSDQDHRSPNITIQINEISSPKIYTSPNSRHVHYQNNPSNQKLLSPVTSKQEKYRSLSPVISFPKSSFGDDGFDCCGSSSRSEFPNLEKD